MLVAETDVVLLQSPMDFLAARGSSAIATCARKQQEDEIRRAAGTAVVLLSYSVMLSYA